MANVLKASHHIVLDQRLRSRDHPVMFVHLSLFESQPHQQRKAIKRRDKDGETLRSIARSHNVSAATISRLPASGVVHG